MHSHVGEASAASITSVDPAVAKAFPGEHIDAARAEQRPERHLHGAGVGGRNDGDAVVGGHAQDAPRLVDGASSGAPSPASSDAPRPTSAFFRISGDQPGRLAVGPVEKRGFAGRAAGFSIVAMALYPSR